MEPFIVLGIELASLQITLVGSMCHCEGFFLRKGNVSMSALPLVCGHTGYLEFLLCVLLHMENPEEQLHIYVLLFPTASTPNKIL